MNRKIIMGVIMISIFLMVSFVPLSDNVSHNNAINKNLPQVSSNKNVIKSTFNPLKLDRYNYSLNKTNNILHINILFNLNNNMVKNQSIIKSGNFGEVNVFSSGNNIYMNITIIPNNNAGKVPLGCSNVYYKFPKNYAAVLSVTKIPIITTTDITEIMAVFGEVVATGVSVTVSSAPAYAEASIASTVVPVVVAVLAANYVAMDVYAYENHDPTVYFDIGASWGTQWWNFYSIGVYGEEGAFTGSANSHSSGTFIPVAIAGGRNYSPTSPEFYEEYFPHNSVWNPYQEPPW